ncbi:hypothetical protein KKF04_02240 [Patescibacteria group bacterium]|nr:hypothetical protein [Patescibacteria group bacterium]
MNIYKKHYLIWFLGLFGAYLFGIMVFVNMFLLNGESFAAVAFGPFILAGIFIRIGMVVITVYYGLKLNIKPIWAWLLGLGTLLTGAMAWVALIIYITKKVPEKSGLSKEELIKTSNIPIYI